MNPLYNEMNNSNDLLKRFQTFRQSFTGDPRQQVQQLLNSGKVTQAQYDRAVQVAQQLQRIIGKF